MTISQYDQCSFRLNYFTVTIGLRSQAKQLFAEVEKHGGYVTYREHKTWFQTTYTHVKFEGERWLMRWAIGVLQSWDEMSKSEED